MIRDILLASYGAAAIVFVIGALFFFRFWFGQRERLFGFFAAAFLCFALGFVIRIVTDLEEDKPYIFIPRLVGFLLIMFAIIDKNRRAR